MGAGCSASDATENGTETEQTATGKWTCCTEYPCASRGDDDFVDAVEAEIAALGQSANTLKTSIWSAQAQAGDDGDVPVESEAPSHADKRQGCAAKSTVQRHAVRGLVRRHCRGGCRPQPPPPAVLMVRPYLGKMSDKERQRLTVSRRRRPKARVGRRT